MENREQPQLLLDYLLHEAESVQMRADWFLIFNAIAFEAFFAARVALHGVVIGVLGCFVNYVWLVVGYRQTWNLRSVTNMLRNPEFMQTTIFNDLFNQRWEGQKRWMEWARSTPAFCVILPAACLIAWFVVTVTAGTYVPWHLAAVIIGICAITSVPWYLIRKGPTIPEQQNG